MLKSMKTVRPCLISSYKGAISMLVFQYFSHLLTCNGWRNNYCFYDTSVLSSLSRYIKHVQFNRSKGEIIVASFIQSLCY